MNTNVKKYVVKEYVIKEYLEDLKNPGDIVRAQIMESVNDEEMMAQCPNDILVVTMFWSVHHPLHCSFGWLLPGLSLDPPGFFPISLVQSCTRYYDQMLHD